MHSRGFTLIEIVVSLFVIGIIIMLSSAILRVTPLSRHARNEDIATKIAENELESLRASGYSALPASGPFTDSLLGNLPSGAGTFTVSDFNTNTKSVLVAVSWVDSGSSAASSVSLTTLVTKTGGLK